MIGFKWKGVDYGTLFGRRCRDLEASKKKFGHCNVSRLYSVDLSLGNWCKDMRVTYTQIQQGKPHKRNLSQDRIEGLGKIGFKWKGVDYDTRFEKRCRPLEAFKKNFGHCNVPTPYSVDPTLGVWYSAMRFTYHQIQQGKPPKYILSQEEIGF